MHDHKHWSLSLGTWSGVRVRLHMFFLLFVAGTLYLNWLDHRQAENQSLTWLVWASLLTLFVSVLLHELGHLLAAERLGTSVDEVVIWPLGNLVSPRGATEPQVEFVTAFAGPLANLLVCGVICFPLLVFKTDSSTMLGLLNPVEPALATDVVSWLVFVKITFWINWMLFLVNLLPAYPFDGGRALRAAIQMFWAGMDRQSAANLVALLAKCCAAAMVGAAILLYQHPSDGPVPAWFALVLMAIFVYFSAKQEESLEANDEDDEVPFGYDFSQGYTSLERSVERSVDPPHAAQEVGPFSRWLDQRRVAKQQRQLEIEAEEERRVDDILARLHEVGMDNLTAEERSLLQRVSKRLRNRQDKG